MEGLGLGCVDTFLILMWGRIRRKRNRNVAFCVLRPLLPARKIGMTGPKQVPNESRRHTRLLDLPGWN